MDSRSLCPRQKHQPKTQAIIWRRRGHKWSRLWSYRPLKGSLKAVLLHRLSEKANPRIEEHFNLRLAVLWYQNIVQASIPSAMCYRMEQKFALYLLSERTIILCMRLRTDACSRCMGSPIIPCGQQLPIIHATEPTDGANRSI